ncbi:hypothetical protein WMY93_013157 [Mugilogobius chulae]|uniref:Ig-like domain-containing protein n=1 Tax=Mugilogobius chulae TaxID=88201 RepID=A0AAW0PBL3_9GOBI
MRKGEKQTALVTEISCITVNIPQDKYEFYRGDNITLPCSFKSRLSNPPLVIITWVAEGIVILTHYSNPGRADFSNEYERRSKLDVDIATGKADLKLFSIGPNDERSYMCRVQIPGDDVGAMSDVAALKVISPPSPPVCKIEGKAEYGQNITLTCRSEVGNPPPIYKWSRDVRNMPRIHPPRSTVRGGVLSLYDISKDSSGFYICTSINKIRSASCNLTLTVLPPKVLRPEVLLQNWLNLPWSGFSSPAQTSSTQNELQSLEKELRNLRRTVNKLLAPLNQIAASLERQAEANVP